jgi:hypothetical protein
LPAVFFAGAAGTYRPYADGDAATYLRTMLLGSGLAVCVYALVRLRAPLTGPWPLAALAGTLALAGALHAGRVLHPAARGAPLAAAADDFRDGRLRAGAWQPSLGPGGDLQVRPGQVALTAAAGAQASLELLVPAPAPWWLRPPASWFLPAAFAPGRTAERVEWDAVVARRGAYFVLVETRPLLVQLTAYGLHLTLREPNRPDVVAELHDAALAAMAAPAGDEPPVPASQPPGSQPPARDESHSSVASSSVAASQPPVRDESAGTHRWRVERAAGEVALSVDGRIVWHSAAPSAADQPFGFIRFGETRPDSLHGGAIEMTGVRYRRWWDRG